MINKALNIHCVAEILAAKSQTDQIVEITKRKLLSMGDYRLIPNYRIQAN